MRHWNKDGCKVTYIMGYGPACMLHNVWIGGTGGFTAKQSHKDDGKLPKDIKDEQEKTS